MDLGLSGKVALVCASSRGIGKSVAASLSAEGASVVICAREEEPLRRAREDIEENTGNPVCAICCDLTNDSDIESLVEGTVERFGAIHILVNNAGGPPAGTFLEVRDEGWLKAFELTFMSAMRCTRKVLPYMIRGEFGRIINISSFTVKQPIENLILSNGVRAGLVGMMKTLSREVADKHITVNTICPGYILTERLKAVIEQRAVSAGISVDEAMEMAVLEIPARRFGTAGEIGEVAAFLASEKASYINGVTMQVDGGLIRGLL